MSIETIRIFLYYPLGLLPSIFFGSRFLLQWIQSERQGRSVVTPFFWKLSLGGNLFLFLHYFIQMQFPFSLIQVGNGMIAWRNLELMQIKKPVTSLWRFLAKLSLLVCFITLLFLLQGIFTHHVEWMRIPLKKINQEGVTISAFWQVIGVIGGFLLAMRFFVQWWHAEKTKRSELNPAFWWCGLTGCLLSSCYFIKIGDTISILNFSFATVGYLRNLMLIRNSQVTN